MVLMARSAFFLQQRARLCSGRSMRIRLCNMQHRKFNSSFYSPVPATTARTKVCTDIHPLDGYTLFIDRIIVHQSNFLFCLFFIVVVAVVVVK